jgi:DNA adenine methylase
MPEHLHYVETHAGGLSVLLAIDPEGRSEVVNDINGNLTNFWEVLKTPAAFKLLQRRLQATPFSESEWKQASRQLMLDEIDVPCAEKFFIHCRQSLAGRMSTFASLSKTRTRRNMNEQASAWLTAIEGLPEVHARLIRVAVLTDDAISVIQREDWKDTLFYLDPPYLQETRTAKEVYEHEMTPGQHEDLLKCLCDIKGKFVLSGYRSTMYDNIAEQQGWRREEYEIPNCAAGGQNKRKMTECVWMNYDPPRGPS